MFAHVLEMQAPPDEMTTLRRLIADDYLPLVTTQPGFINARIEQDGYHILKLIVYWQSQAALESASHSPDVISASINIAAYIPGLQLRQRTYAAYVHVTEHKLPAVG